MLDLGNPADWMQAIKEAVAKGKMKGPRIFRVGTTLDAPPHPDITEVPMERRGHLIYVRDATEARAEVRRQIAAGADCIKIYARLSREQLAAIADEAHKANIPVAGHTRNAREAALAGVDFLEHTDPIAMATVNDSEKYEKVLRERFQDPHYHGGVVIDPALEQDYPPHHLMNPARFEELTQLLVRQNAFLNPTLLAYWKGVNGRRQELDREVYALLNNPKVDYIPLDVRLEMLDYLAVDELDPRLRENLFQGYERVKEFLRAFVKGGGKVVAGVDAVTQTFPGLGTHQEMFLLVDAGLTPLQALLSATSWSAQMMRKQHLVGSVEVGKLGDLLMLKGNPLEDIRNSQKIELVIKDGVIQDTEYHPDFAIPVARPTPSHFANEAPQLTHLNPIFAVEGSEAARISVRGHGFSPHSILLFADVRIPTLYVSKEELQGTIPSRLLARVGTFPVTVRNPQPGGGISDPLKFMVKFR